MATGAITERVTEHAAPRRTVAAAQPFDLAMCAAGAWLLGGAFLDAWAHNHIPFLETFFTPWHAVLYSGLLAVAGVLGDMWAHNHIPFLETFFTPWHAVLYSGLLAVAGVLGGAWLRGLRAGAPWRQALPAGYELAGVGVVLFALGGLGDMTWHLIFGIEQNIDAAMSPTHLLLGCSAALILAGPLRAAWRRPGSAGGLLGFLPPLLSATWALSLVTLVSQFLHPFVMPLAAQEYSGAADVNQSQALGVASIVLQAVLLTGFVLVLARRWRLPRGSLTLMLTANAALLSFMQDQYRFIPVAAAAGLFGDLLLPSLYPFGARARAVRVFACALPLTLYALYFLALSLTSGVWWSVHLWVGSTVIAGLTGLALSYTVVPPAQPVPRPEEG
jgi:hypothetical protein